MANKGLQTFAGDEGSNLLAGQCAAFYFLPLNGDNRVAEVGVGQFRDVDFFFAIKAKCSTADTEVSARSLVGDGLGKTGEYGENASNDLVTMEEGDMIYGCFDKIYTTDGLMLYMKLK